MKKEDSNSEPVNRNKRDKMNNDDIIQDLIVEALCNGCPSLEEFPLHLTKVFDKEKNSCGFQRTHRV